MRRRPPIPPPKSSRVNLADVRNTSGTGSSGNQPHPGKVEAVDPPFINPNKPITWSNLITAAKNIWWVLGGLFGLVSAFVYAYIQFHDISKDVSDLKNDVQGIKDKSSELDISSKIVGRRLDDMNAILMDINRQLYRSFPSNNIENNSEDNSKKMKANNSEKNPTIESNNKKPD